MKKALILFSGGLDSRVTAKFMEELGFLVELCFVKIPFGSGCSSPIDSIEEFSNENNFKLHIIDATRGDNFDEYMKIVKMPKHGRGTAINPCKDCKIFIFKKGKELSEKIGADVICTGEVLGQRPMSQMKKSLSLTEDKADMSGKILRPLCAKLLPETIYEKNGVIEREKLLDINGRRRISQMKLAEKYNITYPVPAGGCLLCENLYCSKLKEVLKERESINFNEISLLRNGRMFKKNGFIFVGRNERENGEIEKFGKLLGWNIIKNTDVPGPTVVFEKKDDENFSNDLYAAYRDNDLNKRKEFEKYKI